MVKLPELLPGQRLQAYIALSALVLVLALAFWIGADILHTGRTIAVTQRIEKTTSIRQKLDSAVQDFLGTNTVWQGDITSNKPNKDGVIILQFDESAKINLNWVNPFVLAGPEFVALFPKGIAAFEEYRRKVGPFSNPIDLKGYVNLQLFETLATLNGTINLNTCDEVLVQELLTKRGGNGQFLRNGLQVNRQSKTKVSETQMLSWLGPEELASQIYTIHSGINVLSAPVPLLNALFNHPSWDFEAIKVQEMVDTIVKYRSMSTTLPEKELSSILGINPEHLVLHYISTRSDTFRLEASLGKSKLILIVLKIQSPEPDSTKAKWKIMRREYSNGSS